MIHSQIYIISGIMASATIYSVLADTIERYMPNGTEIDKLNRGTPGCLCYRVTMSLSIGCELIKPPTFQFRHNTNCT